MYKWMDWVIGPKVNGQIAEWFGEAPANQKSCATTTKGFCEQYHAGDEAFFDKLAFWKTPLPNCGDDRGTACKGYADWVQAWTEIKG
jgi:putative spermidine/putrescine transport system substrate-binding protein